MTSDYAPPSRNPADNDTLVGVLKLALVKFLQRVDDMLPARVIAYNRSTNRAQVQPVIPVVTTSQQQVPRAQVASVPVFQYGGGGAVMSFPLQSGNNGWIKANDRDISLFKQTGKPSPPNTQRKHSFEDGMLFPDAMDGATIADEDANNAVFQDLSGTVRLALWPDHFKFTCPQVAIGDTEGYAPTPNVALDVQSTTKAFCPPRMTTAQKMAITSPSMGMMVFDIDALAISVYNGSAWS